MSNFFSGAKSIFVKLLSLILLACILLLASGFLLNYCSRDNSPVVPLSQNGKKLKSPGLVSLEGDLLLPVKAICENNFFAAETTKVDSESNMLVGYNLLLLPTNENASGVSVTYYVDELGTVVDLTVCKDGKLIPVPGGGKIRKGEIYLPTGVVSSLFNLQVDLTKDGKGIIKSIHGTDKSDLQEPASPEPLEQAPAGESVVEPGPATE